MRRSWLLLPALALGLTLGVSGASADPGFWGSVEVSCSDTPPFEVPSGSQSQNVIARITVINSSGGITFAGQASFDNGPDAVWGNTNDTFWVPAGSAGPTFTSQNEDDSATCDGTGYEVDFADVPTVPTSFSGATTAGNESIEDSQGDPITGESDLVFEAPITDDYTAQVQLAQGAIKLYRADGSTQTFASSGSMDIGSLSAGEWNIPVTTEDGPQAQWTISFQPAPLALTNVSSSLPYIQPDTIVQAGYTLSTDAHVSVDISGPSGIVRQLATNAPQQAGDHTIDWDGLDANGNPVPDGSYSFQISATNVFGSTASGGTAGVLVDSQPPVVTVVSPTKLNPSSGLVIDVHDALSGLKSASLAVDGKHVQSLGSSGTQFTYVPSGGWSSGSHSWSVTAIDNAGNTRGTSGTFTASGTHKKSSLPKLLGRGWQIRPATISYTGDGTGILRHLRWSSWTQKQATGSGAVWIDNCTPNCAHGKFTAHKVRVNAFRPVKGHFTRLTLHYSYRGKLITQRLGIRRFGASWGYYSVG